MGIQSSPVNQPLVRLNSPGNPEKAATDSDGGPFISRVSRPFCVTNGHRVIAHPEGKRSMCGIFGVVGTESAPEDIVDGLSRLEYRGYDSAGLVILSDGELVRRRASGAIDALKTLLHQDPVAGSIGIGHTRWATHGEPTAVNAHPHVESGVAVVHNGIIENHAALREWMTEEGYEFESATDSEVVPKLIHFYLSKGKQLFDAFRQALEHLEGSFAIGAVAKLGADVILAARKGSPLAVATSQDAAYLASDPLALSPWADRVTHLEDGDMAILKAGAARVVNWDVNSVRRPVTAIDSAQAAASIRGFEHHTLKEIHETPEVLARTLEQGDVADAWIEALDAAPRDGLNLIACGTSLYAGRVAARWFLDFAGVNLVCHVASEFRYQRYPLHTGGVSLFVSQSGETADSLGALRFCRDRSQKILSVVNVPGSSMDREADACLHTYARQEIGVASTKAFSAQLMVFAQAAISLGERNGRLGKGQANVLKDKLKAIPEAVAKTLRLDEPASHVATLLTDSRSAIFLGRGQMHSLALEGALKLSELSYIHSQGFPAGELKHGPIALISEGLPVVMLSPSDGLFEKNASNLEEVCARGARGILLSEVAGVRKLSGRAAGSLTLPACPEEFRVFVYSIPLQLLAYHAALHLGLNVDKPRNLAKSVTVE